MQVAISASVQGLQRAGERMDRAAATIAAPTPATARGSDPSPAPPTGNEGLTAAQASGEMERAMVDAIVARRAYEANAKALRIADEAQRSLINRGA
jgi:flagellar hook protein FlgE